VTIDEFLEGKNAEGVELFRRFQAMVEACGPSEPSVSRTVAYFRRTRVFAGGFVAGRRLELVIDLTRSAEHPCLIGSFASTKRVVSHRLRIADGAQLDASVAALLREAYETVGPGTRGLH
jgi:Domain of unknown function (DUF5655)